MTIWITTDTHFGHENMHSFSGRPQGYEERILRSVRNSVRADDDILIHLGDVSWRDDEAWHQALRKACPAKMWLVMGNHDNKSINWYLGQGWDFAADSISLIRHSKFIIFSHQPVAIENPKIINWADEPMINIFGHHHNTGHHQFDHYHPDTHRLIMSEHEYRPFSLREVLEDSWLDKYGGRKIGELK